MISPFANDPFALVWEAFKNLYPDKECTCFFDIKEEKTEEGEDIFGETFFGDDGNIDVFVDARLSINDAVEVFAHELAHVTVGNGAGHGPEWEDAFEKIFSEYNRIGEKLFDVPTEENNV